MKQNLISITLWSLLLAFLVCSTQAGTLVYDLKADWSDTQNPNGTWSYRSGAELMIGSPFSWVAGDAPFSADMFSGTPFITTSPSAPTYEYNLGFDWLLMTGDVVARPLAGESVILWSAPESGIVNIQGSIWPSDLSPGGVATFWKLGRNGVLLTDGFVESIMDHVEYSRNLPFNLAMGSGGSVALENIAVAAGDQLALTLSGGDYMWWDGPIYTPGSAVGVNFTVTLTTASVDPATAIQQLAESVAEMNLQNGIENSLDSKLDAALGALDDLNANNDAAACNSLVAFISAVEAQRDNKISSTQADQLIASAQNILAQLSTN